MKSPLQSTVQSIHFHQAPGYQRIGIGRLAPGQIVRTVRSYTNPTQASLARIRSQINYHRTGTLHLFSDGWSWTRRCERS